MNERDKTILVIGATGQQGGAVACHLLTDGWRVRTLTRNPQKDAARALVDAGVEVLPGNIDDRASLERAAEGVHGIFGVTQFWEHGYEAEIRHGKAIVDAVVAAGVKQFVFSTMGGTDRDTGMRHAESKWEVEKYIKTKGLTATVLRPVFFMENFRNFSRLVRIEGVPTLSLPLHPTTRLQMVAVDDIGAFAAMAFARPGEFAGQALELAGDALTMPQVAAAFTHFLGEPVRFVEAPIEPVRAASPESAHMFQWFNDVGYHADILALRRLHPKLKTFEMWLDEGGFPADSIQPEAGVTAPA